MRTIGIRNPWSGEDFRLTPQFTETRPRIPRAFLALVRNLVDPPANFLTKAVGTLAVPKREKGRAPIGARPIYTGYDQYES